MVGGAAAALGAAAGRAGTGKMTDDPGTGVDASGYMQPFH